MTTQFDGSPLTAKRKQPEMIEIDDDECCISSVNVDTINQNGLKEALVVMDDNLNINNQPQIIDEYQLDDNVTKSEEIDLKPLETYSIFSTDNLDGSLMMKHHPSSSYVCSNQSLNDHHNNSKPANATEGHQLSVDSDCFQLEYQQVNILKNNVKIDDLSHTGLENEMDCQIMKNSKNSNEEYNQQFNERIEERPIKNQREPIVLQAENISNQPKMRTITLKMPPINGQTQPNNLILKIGNNNQATAITEKPISSLTLKPAAKMGTTKPIIQTINLTPKLIIKPLMPPSDLASTTSSTSNASCPTASASTSKTNDSAPEKVKTRCMREGCTNLAIKSCEWDEEFCSAKCLITYCKICFKNWVTSRQNENH